MCFTHNCSLSFEQLPNSSWPEYNCQRKFTITPSSEGKRVFSSTDDLMERVIPGCHFQSRRGEPANASCSPSFLPSTFLCPSCEQAADMSEILWQNIQTNSTAMKRGREGPCLESCRKQFESVTRSLRMGSKDRAFTPSAKGANCIQPGS